MKVHICPECVQDKHGNCDGGAWDFDNDTPAICTCWADNHLFNRLNPETEQPDDNRTTGHGGGGTVRVDDPSGDA